MSFENGLAGYRVGYTLTHPWAIPIYYWREVKYFWQRGRRGYSDRDGWDIGDYLLSWLPEAIEKLEKRQFGCPVGMDPEQWRHALHEMVLGLKSAKRINDAESWPKDPEEFKRLKRHADEGLNLLKKHFFSLWD